MKRRPLWPFFLLALVFAFFSPYWLPGIGLFAFAPFLTRAFISMDFPKSLWLAAICGFIVDLLSSDFPFGIHALNHTLVTLLLYRFRHAFVETPMGLSSFTFVFSFLATGVYRISFVLFGKLLPFTLFGVITDFIALPVLDALYAFLWFSCPFMLYVFSRKQWFRFHFFWKENKKKVGGH